MERRTLIAVVLSFVVLYAYQAFFMPSPKKPTAAPAVTSSAEAPAASQAEAATAATSFTFLQISDSHVGFDKAANPNALGTLQEAIAKVKATEMLAMVADEALQIHGGMGLMSDLPLERIWRDARIERIWDGTSEVQRHIISRGLLRPLGG